jgi:anti-anti-sigma regulatory factor
VPFSEYWAPDLPRSLVERVASTTLFPAAEARRRSGDVVRCGPDLRVRLSTEAGDVRVLSLAGAIDLSNVAALRAVIGLVLAADRPRALVLDAGEVTLGSLRGLEVLVEAGYAAATAGASYAVAGLTPLHLRLLGEVWPRRDLAHLGYASPVAAVAGLAPLGP